MDERLSDLLAKADEIAVRIGNRIIELEEQLEKIAEDNKEDLRRKIGELREKKELLEQHIEKWKGLGDKAISGAIREFEEMKTTMTSMLDEVMAFCKKLFR